MINEIDFPATHSVDSEWFALDENGFVALFNTHSKGVIPVKYGHGIFTEALSKILKRKDDCLFQMHLPELLAKRIINACLASEFDACSYFDYGFEGFFLLMNPITETEGYNSDEFTLELSDSENLYYCYLTPFRLKLLSERKIIRAAIWADDCAGRIDNPEIPNLFDMLGIYVYENEEYKESAENYKRVIVPDPLLNVQELKLTESSELLVFPVSFAERDEIRPTQYTECEGLQI